MGDDGAGWRHNSRMSQAIDPRWPRVLSVCVHEFRTPLSVQLGYVKMLLSGRIGELTEKQRHMLQEVEKSCARLSALVAETSELSKLEGGTLAFNMREIDLHATLQQAADSLPPMADGRDVPISLDLEPGPARFQGDPARLAQAFTSLFAALRREVISGDPLTVRGRQAKDGYELEIGDTETLAALAAETRDHRAIYDEWRDGVGLSVMVARRILHRHGGRLLAAPDGRKTGARIVFGETPQSSTPISES